LDTDNHIQIPSEPGWSASYKMAQYAKTGGDDFLIGYNHRANRIQFKNLSRKTNEHSISLVSEGPNSIPEVVSFYFHNPDSIFVLSFFSLSLVDMQGQIKWIEKINRQGSKVKGLGERDVIWCDINHGSPIYFDDDEGSIYFAFKPFHYTEKNRFQQELCGKLKLADFSVEKLPIYLPEKFREHYYGPFERVNFNFQDDRIVYCTLLDPIIYYFDKATGKTTEYDYQLKYTKNLAPPAPMSMGEGGPEALRYFSENPMFFQVFFDGQWYYRCNMGEFNRTTGGRKKFMMVIDTDFNLALEAPLPESTRILASNITAPSGLLFYQMLEEDESIDQYVFIKVNCRE
jgi:Domain of unknown function (DUF4221)